MSLALVVAAGLLASACSSVNKFAGETIADLPLIGLPADAPPRPGTPAYDAWVAKRAQDAATPKPSKQNEAAQKP